MMGFIPTVEGSLRRILNESLDAKAGAKRLEELRQAKAKEISN